MQKYSMMLAIAKLRNNFNALGLYKDAGEMTDLLMQLLEDGDMEEDADDRKISDIAVNSNGLREDGTFDNMNQGFSLPPFFSNPGSLG